VKFSKRIRIHQRLDSRGRSTFFIIHQYGFKKSIKDVPKAFRVFDNLDDAEYHAIYLIKNYENIFM
jgi:hypothetical protein